MTNPSSEITKMLVLCTAHLSARDADALSDEMQQQLGTAPFIAFDKSDYGWFAYVPRNADPREAEDVFPASLRDCFVFARAHGCEWIMFDRDADTVDVLPIYDW